MALKRFRIDIEELSLEAAFPPAPEALQSAIAREVALRLSGGAPSPGDGSPVAAIADAILQAIASDSGPVRF